MVCLMFLNDAIKHNIRKQLRLFLNENKALDFFYYRLKTTEYVYFYSMFYAFKVFELCLTNLRSFEIGQMKR